MVGIEALEQRQHVVRMGPDEVANERLETGLVCLAQLGLSWRDPERRGAAIACHPDRPARDCAVEEQPPQQPVLVHALLRSRERPVPGRV
jgi:hypothetical protein